MVSRRATTTTETTMNMPLIQIGPGGSYTTRYVPRGSRLIAVEGSAQESPLSDNAFAHTFESSRDSRRQQSANRAGAGSSLIARLLGVDRFEPSLAAGDEPASSQRSAPAENRAIGSLCEAASAWLTGQIRTLAQAAEQVRTLGAQLTVAECRLAVIAASRVAGSLPRTPGRHATAHHQSLAQAITRITIGSVMKNQLRGVLLTGNSSYRFEEEHRYEPNSQTAQDSAVDPRFAHRAWLFANHARARRRARHQQGDGLRARRGADQKRRFEARSQQGSLFVHL